MFLDKEINKLFDAMQKRTSFINLFILGKELNSTQKKKKNKHWVWAGLILVVYLGILLAINQWLSIEKFLNLKTLNINGLSDLLLISFIIIVPVWLTIYITLNNISSTYKLPIKGINALRNHFLNDEFQKWIKDSYISDEVIWNYVLPYVEKQIKIKDNSSSESYFRAFIPGISVSIPIAIMSMMVAVWIADPEDNRTIGEAMNIIFSTFGITAIVVVMYALMTYKLLAFSFRRFSSKGNYQNLEYLIYAHFFEKERRKSWI
ncbi:MAG TPA: hypothetical protein VK105_08545 [Virgibacillus sp.]|nr:hypothetical protein [Virgibacillus sp.]HLR67167.1 hypothetical protein [Virgibacillus sp.]